MNEWQRVIAWLAGIGALIAVGQALTNKEPLSWRIIVGRAILGAALSMIAGVCLLEFPDAPMPVLVGIGSALGMLGEQVLELAVRRFITFRIGGSKCD